MKFTLQIASVGAVLSALVSQSSAYSINSKIGVNGNSLSSRSVIPNLSIPSNSNSNNHGPITQKEVLRMTTKRDTIKMPTQTPMVPWTPPGSDYAQFVDIYSAMYRDRTLMIHKFIDEEVANELISIILYMRKEDSRQDISIYFNVPGALLRPALAVYDLIQQTKESCDVETVNLGLCAGMGAFLAGSGTKGKRSAMPNSRFLLQRTGIDKVFQGQATDIVLEVRNVKAMNDRMELALSDMTGQTTERIQQDLKRDFYLGADEAVQYGLIDQVLLPAPLKRAARGQEADLGAFEGEEEQRYQNQDNEGGWGNQRPQQPPAEKKKKDDDDGPQIAKG
uniref:ATP-dependent Clp protease proteolytic subunit n=1 Tax=Craspedostauros australis TaxID=1486917 RepID=A0A7S0F6Q4_9STRA|mmetsp:Transcript_9303/g.25221  ORF Transcript_9303/g.25221 Transcript_9303/m.25221 type:complete len:336 (+) Transcript_9303:88-1095(+)|eukprot:CAMPEP_0198117950 /NCGR_PEP_ID=MMETSP1442-20131203/19836_1 /TAXON_ID= /ORGANISM="Craspedostauros australis, Strain CCMP3328" /LENGTH=335 /DNA_ID=CAMNT_0043776115 /DNA_START=51 /DNA_END=1058 /DNA_ORIENTATION=+